MANKGNNQQYRHQSAMSDHANHNVHRRDRPKVHSCSDKQRTHGPPQFNKARVIHRHGLQQSYARSGHHGPIVLLSGIDPTSSIAAAITLHSCKNADTESADSSSPRRFSLQPRSQLTAARHAHRSTKSTGSSHKVRREAAYHTQRRSSEYKP
jgi:hypothetical protein